MCARVMERGWGVKWSSRNSTRASLWIVVTAAAVIFFVIPAAQSTVGGSGLVWAFAALATGFLGWALSRWTVSLPRAWREARLLANGSQTLILLQESKSREAGAGAFRVREDGVEIEFPDREDLVVTWHSISNVALVQEKLGRKWRLEIERKEPADRLVIYPLKDDSVSMEHGKHSAQRLFSQIESMRPRSG
jgi:hypothetical protein